MARVAFAGLGAAVLSLSFVPSSSAGLSSSSDSVTAAQPNFVVLLLDDARVDDFEPAYMPATNSLVGDQGARFDRFYSPFPLCCPARATLLTGQYAHNHGVIDNLAPYGVYAFDDSHTLGTWLDATYQTGFIGKYLNGYGDSGTDTSYIPPGWDEWDVPLEPALYDYMSFDVNHDGAVSRVDQYATAWSGDQAVKFIGDAALSAEPFFLYTAFIAPHNGPPHTDSLVDIPSPFVEPKYQDTYSGPARPADPSFNEADVSDKNPRVAMRPRLTSQQIAQIADLMAQRREALASVDDQIARIMEVLSATGQLDNTYVFVTSDNGFMLGEHRFQGGKKMLYEPSSRIPLQIRGPAVPTDVRIDKMSGLMDFAPTILDLADIPVTSTNLGLAMDGRSLVGAFDNVASPHPVVLEDHSDTTPTDPGGWLQRGLATDRWVYIRFPAQNNFEELYDMSVDPFQRENLAGKRAYVDQLRRLREQWSSRYSCSGSACR